MRSDVARDRSSRGPGNALLGIRIGAGTQEDLVLRSLHAIDGLVPQCVFACANPHSLVEAQRDPHFREALKDAAIVVADGVGVTLVAGLLKVDVGPRITGQAYFDAVMSAVDARGGGRVFFFGSTEVVLERIRTAIAAMYPHVTVCGTLSPPFRRITAEENRDMVEAINRAAPDVLWVGMTAPKQEKWVHDNAHSLRVPVIGSVGAVFEFIAGTNPRAPRWMCSVGLEWAYRLAREPGRLWRRTFVSAPKFLLLAVRRHVAGS